MQGAGLGVCEMEFLAVPQESSQPEIAEAFVDVAGARLHYLRAGAGPPMLLIHGLVGSSQNWRNNIGALASSASVYAPDLLNTGKSQRVSGLDTSLKAIANRMVASMDALGLGAVDIVAHSHGGAIALMLAALRPQRVRRLILFAPANPHSRSGDRLVRFYSSRWGGLALRMLPYLPAPIQRIALGKLYGGPDRVMESCLRTYTEVLSDSSTVHHILSILRCWFVEMSKLRRALRRVARIPTLLVWGDRDCTVSLSSGIRLHRRLPASELIVVPGRPLRVRRSAGGGQPYHAGMAWPPSPACHIARHVARPASRRTQRVAGRVHSAPAPSGQGCLHRRQRQRRRGRRCCGHPKSVPWSLGVAA